MKVEISERYRTPLQSEREMGLWVDRIGNSTARQALPSLRILNLYGVVAAVDGQGVFNSLGSGKIKFEAGDAMLLFPLEPAAYGSVDAPWTTEWIVWNGKDAEQLVASKCFSPDYPLIKNGAAPMVKARQHLAALLGQEDISTVMERRVILLDMLLELYRRQNVSATRRHRDLTSLALGYIEANLHRAFAIEELAKHCGLSESHFRRLFKLATGASPVEFVTSRRISAAKQMLRQNIPVKEIARRLVFSNELYFRRVFKETVGLPPGQYY